MPAKREDVRRAREIGCSVDTHRTSTRLISTPSRATRHLPRQSARTSADWWHADHKDAWRDKARNALRGEP